MDVLSSFLGIWLFTILLGAGTCCNALLKENVIICSGFVSDSEKKILFYTLINKKIVCRYAIYGSIYVQGLFSDLVNCATVIVPSDVAAV